MEIINKKFGKLFVIKKSCEKASNGEYKYECLCDCGKKTNVKGSNLKNGNTKSCGCSRNMINAKLSKGYRKNNIRLYNIWASIRQRCYYKKSKQYKDYGGRGIKICDEWLNNFVEFELWAKQNGYKENLTIDRINVDGNYEPSNCRWVTMKEQNNNKRNNRYIEYNNEIHTLSEWSDILGFSQQKLKYRLDNWDLESAFSK